MTPDSPLEIEYKWQVPVSASLARLAKLALPDSGKPHHKEKLYNRDYYFDTPERQIEKSSCAMRLRACGGKFLLTVKSATALKNGMASRKEDNLAIKASTLRGAVTEAAKLNPFGIKPEKLRVLFKIYNRRTDYRLNFAGCSALASFDDVTIHLAMKAVRMKEIELEFAGGALEYFHALAGQMARTAGLTPCAMSKVATARAALEFLG
ncbi:MAG: CYTH domain-containing protein [Elusimicrobiaceae bacterium]